MKTPYGEAADVPVTQYAIEGPNGERYMQTAWSTEKGAADELARVLRRSAHVAKYSAYRVVPIKTHLLLKPYNPFKEAPDDEQE